MDEFRAAQESLKGPGVVGWWGRVIPELDPAQRERLLEAGKDRTISNRAISIVLTQWGYDISSERVSHWRRNHVY